MSVSKPRIYSSLRPRFPVSESPRHATGNCHRPGDATRSPIFGSRFWFHPEPPSRGSDGRLTGPPVPAGAERFHLIQCHEIQSLGPLKQSAPYEH